MAADDTGGERPAGPVVLRIKLRYDDVDAMVARFAPNVGKSGLFLPTKSIQPVGTEVKFELRLVNNSPVLVGLGRVKHVRHPDPNNPKAAFGMAIELTRVSREGRDVILKMLERRRAMGLPEVAIPIPEDVETARRAEVDTQPKVDAVSAAIPDELSLIGSAPVLLTPPLESGPIAVVRSEEYPPPTSGPIATVRSEVSALPTSGPVATVRSETSTRVPVTVLAPEQSRPRRPRVEELIERAAELSSRVVKSVPELDVAVDIDRMMSRARSLATGDLDADLAALRDSAAAPIEIGVDVASAELARQLGGKPIAKRERSGAARWTPPPAIELRAPLARPSSPELVKPPEPLAEPVVVRERPAAASIEAVQPVVEREQPAVAQIEAVVAHEEPSARPSDPAIARDELAAAAEPVEHDPFGDTPADRTAVAGAVVPPPADIAPMAELLTGDEGADFADGTDSVDDALLEAAVAAAASVEPAAVQEAIATARSSQPVITSAPDRRAHTALDREGPRPRSSTSRDMPAERPSNLLIDDSSDVASFETALSDGDTQPPANLAYGFADDGMGEPTHPGPIPSDEEVSDIDVLAEADQADADLLASNGEAEVSGGHARARAHSVPLDYARELEQDYGLAPAAYEPELPGDDFAARLELGDDEEQALPSDDIDLQAAREFDAVLPDDGELPDHSPALGPHRRLKRASSELFSDYTDAEDLPQPELPSAPAVIDPDAILLEEQRRMRRHKPTTQSPLPGLPQERPRTGKMPVVQAASPTVPRQGGSVEPRTKPPTSQTVALKKPPPIPVAARKPSTQKLEVIKPQPERADTDDGVIIDFDDE